MQGEMDPLAYLQALTPEELEQSLRLMSGQDAAALEQQLAQAEALRAMPMQKRSTPLGAALSGAAQGVRGIRAAMDAGEASRGKEALLGDQLKNARDIMRAKQNADAVAVAGLPIAAGSASGAVGGPMAHQAALAAALRSRKARDAMGRGLIGAPELSLGDMSELTGY